MCLWSKQMLALKKTQSDEKRMIIMLCHAYYDYRIIVDEAVKQLGGIDILILNAAYSPPPTVFTEYENPVRDYVTSYITLALSTNRVNCSLMCTSKSIICCFKK